jgi:hypothetical protein
MGIRVALHHVTHHGLRRELLPYLEPIPTGARVAQLVGRARDDIVRPGRRSVDVLVDVNPLIQRSLRFFPFGHSRGTRPMPAQERSEELPLTLDLRRPSA